MKYLPMVAFSIVMLVALLIVAQTEQDKPSVVSPVVNVTVEVPVDCTGYTGVAYTYCVRNGR